MSSKLLTLHVSLIAELQREKNKMKGYKYLKRELEKIWDMPVKAIPVVLGALGTTPKKIKQQLNDTGIETRIVKLQKTTILFCKDPLKCS